MEIETVVLLLVLVALVCYFLGRRKGKKVGRKEFFDEICDRSKKYEGTLTDGDGHVYDVTTNYQGQEICIQPEFEHPWG